MIRGRRGRRCPPGPLARSSAIRSASRGRVAVSAMPTAAAGAVRRALRGGAVGRGFVVLFVSGGIHMTEDRHDSCFLPQPAPQESVIKGTNQRGGWMSVPTNQTRPVVCRVRGTRCGGTGAFARLPGRLRDRDGPFGVPRERAPRAGRSRAAGAYAPDGSRAPPAGFSSSNCVAKASGLSAPASSSAPRPCAPTVPPAPACTSPPALLPSVPTPAQGRAPRCGRARRPRSVRAPCARRPRPCRC
jgi:hypothetical protein